MWWTDEQTNRPTIHIQLQTDETLTCVLMSPCMCGTWTPTKGWGLWNSETALHSVLPSILAASSFYSSLYLLSVNTTLYSRDGVMWVLNCSRSLPDITTEKVQFLFNQNFHKCFFFPANSRELHALKQWRRDFQQLCVMWQCVRLSENVKWGIWTVFCVEPRNLFSTT